MTAAWLWQADGPAMGARGVVDDEAKARQLAADCLRSGAASCAVVEEAVTGGLGAQTLASGYPRTGHAWRGRLGADGEVRWTAVRAA